MSGNYERRPTKVVIAAVVVGNLAVHQSLGGFPKPFTVTHIASGYAVALADNEPRGILIAEKIGYLFDDMPADLALDSAAYTSWLKGLAPVMTRILKGDA